MTSTLQVAYDEVALTNSRLRAEVERLTARNVVHEADIERLQAELDCFNKELSARDATIERLTIAIDMLRKAAEADGFHRVLAARDAEIGRLQALCLKWQSAHERLARQLEQK